jgi:hypothetical protein
MARPDTSLFSRSPGVKRAVGLQNSYPKVVCCELNTAILLE